MIVRAEERGRHLLRLPPTVMRRHSIRLFIGNECIGDHVDDGDAFRQLPPQVSPIAHPRRA